MSKSKKQPTKLATASVVAVWLVYLMAALGIAFEMLSKSDTVANLFGLALLFGTVYFSVSSKCFTKYLK